ncbi:13357_t:CDS:2 [Acaulospora colombiana]|uniref:13357_t:CDS:1 n=1 Tax=Acaulospora colombiana TaxID=27376 RepID=A0ACA9MGS0_9GLOM|nr:13357_t:CDS:2 [Acaulospora colombiana]
MGQITSRIPIIKLFKKNSKRPFKVLRAISESDADRMQLLHHFIRESWKGNFSAPVEDILNVDGTEVLDEGARDCKVNPYMVDRIQELMCSRHLTNINHQCRELLCCSSGDIKDDVGSNIVKERLKIFLQSDQMTDDEIENLFNRFVTEAKVHKSYVELHRFWGQKG